MIEYRIVNCLGHLNVAKAIEDRQNEDPAWRVHSLVAADVEEVQHGVKLEMAVQLMRVTRFVLVMERDIVEPSVFEKPRAV